MPFPAFVPPAADDLRPEGLLAAAFAAPADGVELDAPCLIAEQFPLLSCVFLHSGFSFCFLLMISRLQQMQ